MVRFRFLGDVPIDSQHPHGMALVIPVDKASCGNDMDRLIGPDNAKFRI